MNHTKKKLIRAPSLLDQQSSSSNSLGLLWTIPPRDDERSLNITLPFLVYEKVYGCNVFKFHEGERTLGWNFHKDLQVHGMGPALCGLLAVPPPPGWCGEKVEFGICDD